LYPEPVLPEPVYSPTTFGLAFPPASLLPNAALLSAGGKPVSSVSFSLVHYI